MTLTRKLLGALAATATMGAAAAAFFVPMTPAGAGGSATINVDTTDDENNNDGDCSLREAVESANTNTAVDDCESGEGDDTVMIPAGTYTFDAEGDGEIDVDSNVAFVGAGASTTIIDANEVDRVFQLNDDEDEQPDIVVSFDGVTITNGLASGSGGGIQANSTDLTIRNSIITENEAEDGDGGGIRSDDGGSSLTVENSVISNNTSSFDGGGIEQDNDDTTVTIVDTTITGNTAGSEGGGIHIDNDSTTTITGSTISNNVAEESPRAEEESVQGFRRGGPPRPSACDGGGGGINQDDLRGDASTEIVNSTISGNTAPDCEGGGIYVVGDLVLTHVTIVDNGASEGGNLFSRAADPTSVTVGNTVIADPRSSDDCVIDGDALVSSGGNIDSDGTCGLGEASDQTVADVQLGALADNGGSTQTHLPQAGSAAIDTALEANCVADDQRDVARPQDGDDDGTTACDVGAVEVVFTPEPTTPVTDPEPDDDVDADTATPATPTVARPTFTG